jgi:D-alanine-D-alanine ligase-like ATP-grasp enzyme
MDTQYLRALKSAVAGSPERPLVLVCNFEAEDEWAGDHVGMPVPTLAVSTALVRRMEQLGALLAGPGDVLLLGRPLDAGYRAYLADLGLIPPATVVVDADAEGSTTRAALASPVALERLSELAGTGAALLPMGTTAAEERLAEVTGLPLAVPGAATFARVNGKIYGRRLVERAGLRAVPGVCCESVADLAAAVDLYRDRLGADGFRVVIKDSYGVSGRGLVVLDDAGRADRLLRMVERRAARTGDQRLHVVVEEWLPKRCDLNYQVTIAHDGRFNLDFVKQAITENGVHKGHIMPPELTAAQHAEIAAAGAAVARHLHSDGYHGVVGVDAIVDINECVYPVLELNARLNMSTYQGSLTERLQGSGEVAMAIRYQLRLDHPLGFDELRRVLGPLLTPRPEGRFVVTCFGTVNANAHRPAPFEGRLHALLIAPDRERLAALDADAAAALDRRPILQESR